MQSNCGFSLDKEKNFNVNGIEKSEFNIFCLIHLDFRKEVMG
jgi:hypothetical protein